MKNTDRHRILCRWISASIAIVSSYTFAGTLYVTNGDSDGLGTLRYAIEQAADGDTIRINGSACVCLTNQITISESRFQNKGLVIDGYGATISGENKCRIFEIQSQNKITIRNSLLVNGYHEGNGGAISNDGDLTIEHSTIKDNHAYSYGRGGGIYNAGNLSLIDVAMSRNVATHDHLSGSYVSPADRGAGGGIFNQGGNVLFKDSSASQNYAQKSACWLFSSNGRISIEGSRFEKQNGIIDGYTNGNYGVIARIMKGNVCISNSTFTNNNTMVGKALFDCSGACSISGEDAYKQTNIVSIVVCDSIFADNSATTCECPYSTVGGGALLSARNIAMTKCTFVRNEMIPSPGSPDFEALIIAETLGVTNCIIKENSGICLEAENTYMSESLLQKNDGNALCVAICATVSNSNFIANKTIGSGAAIYSMYENTDIDIDYCVFSNNIAYTTSSRSNASGGAIYRSDVIRKCKFFNNVASIGGAVYQPSKIVDCVFQGNSAITNSDNYASGRGGAIYSTYGVVINSSFVGNSATQTGGAICFCCGTKPKRQNGSRIIVGSLFLRNSIDEAYVSSYSPHGGSGVYCYGGYAYTYILSSTIVGNLGCNQIGDSNSQCTSISLLNSVVEGREAKLPYGNIAGNVITAWSQKPSVKYWNAYDANGLVVESKKIIEGVQRIYLEPASDSELRNAGVLIWHDSAWTNIAYSLTLEDTKLAVRGDGELATDLIAYDAIGNKISAPATIGAIYCTTADPIPEIGENPTANEILSALGGSADEKLSVNITDADNYNAYRMWAETVKSTNDNLPIGPQAVKDAPNAWLSFALGSETLIETAPTDGDLKVDKFEPASESGKFDFTVSVKDIEVGSDAAADNLKKVFGLEGGTTLESGGMSSDNVSITFGTPVDGKVKFTAGPKNSSEGTFFMKVKMTP